MYYFLLFITINIIIIIIIIINIIIIHGRLHGCSCSTQQITRSLRLLVSYLVKHSKRNSISTRAHVLFSNVYYYYYYHHYYYYYKGACFVYRLSGLQINITLLSLRAYGEGDV